MYAWAEDGGRAPHWIEAGRMVDRFGAQAVFGRQMGVAEMRRISLAERVADAHRAHAAAASTEDGSAGWAQKNADAAALLGWAMRAHTDE